MPSVMEAAMNSAAASSSFSPLAVGKRSLESTQMSTGMLRMRTSVMELGRFTCEGPSVPQRDWLDYPPAGRGKQCEVVPYTASAFAGANLMLCRVLRSCGPMGNDLIF